MNAIKDAHYNLGIAYLESGEYDRAIPEFETAIKIDPTFVEAHCALCRAYLEQNELEKAATAITTALKLDATHQPAILLCNTITEAYYDAGKAELSERRYAEAVSLCQKALSLGDNISDNARGSDIENNHIYAHLGAAYIGLEAYEKAIEALKNAIALDADLVDAHYNLGYAYVAQASYENAVPHLERAITIAPHLKRAHYHLARAHRELGNFEAATDALMETLRLDPNYQPAQELKNAIKQVHYNKGVTYLNTDRYSEAVTAFQNAITLDSDFTTAHYNLGLTYYKMEMYPRALDALQKAIALDPTFIAAHHALALAYFGAQELGKATAAAKETLRLDPNYQPARSFLETIDPSFTPPEPVPPASDPPTPSDPDAKPKHVAHYELGTAYRDSGRQLEAILEFQKAIEIAPDFLSAHVSLGEAYFDLEHLDEAESAANAALKIDSNCQPAHQLLNVINAARQSSESETEVSDSTTESASSDSETDAKEKYYKRAEAFMESGQYNEAAAAYKRAIKIAPNFADAYYGLSVAYLQIGAFSDARAAAESASQFKFDPQEIRELLNIIKRAEKQQRREKFWKTVLSYTAVLAVVLFGAIWVYRIWQNGNTDAPLTAPQIELTGSLTNTSRKGFLKAGETGRLQLMITNKGKTVRDVELKVEPVKQGSIAGLKFMNPRLISVLPENRTETIRIPITADTEIQGRDQTLQLLLFGENKTRLATAAFSFKVIPETPDPIPPRR